MPARKFKNQIEIVPKQSAKLYNEATDMERVAGQKFVDDIYEMLEELYKKPLGKSLLDKIEAAGKDVIIYKNFHQRAVPASKGVAAISGVGAKGSAALPYPATAENEIKRFVKLRQIPTIAVTALKKNNSEYVPPDMVNYGAEFHKVLEASRMKRSIAAVLIGIKEEDLDEIEHGRKQLPEEAYGRFAMAFYQWLTPGEGCDVGLRFDNDQSTVDDPAFIILGHELVHVWRMVTGVRIFKGGWEEEAMTTGLPPFLNMEFSENKLRAENNKTIRTSYTALCGTNHYQTVTQLGGGKGIWPEHVAAWEKWKKENPEGGKIVKGQWIQNPINLKKKSVFSLPIRNFLKY